MFRITGKSISNRVTASRTGLRARRLPNIVLGSGAVIKIHPNRQVLITEDDLRANLNRLLEVSSYISVSRDEPPFSEISLLELDTPTPEVVPEPVVEVVPEPEPEPVVEPEPEPVVEPEPEPEPVPEKKTRRKRRSKKSED